MANTKISQLTENTNPTGGEELVYAYNNANGKMSLNTMKTFAQPDLSGYVTTTDLNTGLSTKQDTLTSGTNIKTVNGNSLLGSGNIDISGGVTYTAGTGIDITGGVVSNTGVTSVNGQTGDVTVSGGGTVTYDYSAMQGPCATGFHIPYEDEWSELYTMGTTISAFSTGTDFATYLKLPLGGIRKQSDSTTDNQGAQGRYWSATSYSNDSAGGVFFGTGAVNIGQYHKAYGYMLRGFKDNPVKPNPSWTTLFDGSSTAAGAGIFYNPYDGLISISADGETWITIADKNVGATAVWEYGDTPSGTNAGTYFQWGNNSGFAYTGTVTTSGTQVDASAYGPGNYYSSSTFITGHNDWSSVTNDNLWGAVTGPVEITGGVTELTADANIWELDEGEYITTYDLYYRTGMKLIPQGYQDDYKTYIRVIIDDSANTNRGFLAFNVDDAGNHGEPSMWFGTSTNATWGYAYPVKDCTYMLKYNSYNSIPSVSGTDITIGGSRLGFIIDSALSGTYSLKTYSNNTYIGMEHYVYIPTQTSNYTISIGTLDNPFNVTLPSNTQKACLMKFYCQGASDMMLIDCKIAS